MVAMLQNLLSEGVGILVSTLAIAPLTALFVEHRHKRRLAPVRVQFLRAVAGRLKGVADDYLHIFVSLGFLKQNLEHLAFRDQARRYEATLRRIQQGMRPRVIEEGSLRDEVLLVASLHSDAIRNFDALKRDLASIERLIEIYTPMLEPRMLASVAQLSDELDEQLTKFRCFRNYLRGTATLSERARALGSAVDFSEALAAINGLLVECGHPELRQHLVAPDLGRQRAIIEAIGRVVDEVFYQEILAKLEAGLTEARQASS